MSAVTTPNGFTYPVGGDAVGALDTIVQSLAEQVDDHVGLHKSGTGTSGTMVVNTNKDITVTYTTPFPAGGPVPNVVITPQESAPQTIEPVVMISGDRTGFVCRFRRNTGTSAIVFYWHADNVGNW